LGAVSENGDIGGVVQFASTDRQRLLQGKVDIGRIAKQPVRAQNASNTATTSISLAKSSQI
jgi:hypothetical protein